MEVVKFDSEKMGSREIAELTGKEHRHVLRDCENLNKNYEKLGLPKIGQGYYTHEKTGNQQHRQMMLTKIQTMDLMTGYNVELRIKINRRWEELEKGLIPQSYGAALMAAAQKQLQIELLEKEVEVSKKEIQIEKNKREVQQMLSEALWDKEDKYALIPKWRK